jgi:hypothetical protein
MTGAAGILFSFSPTQGVNFRKKKKKKKKKNLKEFLILEC